MSCHPPSTKFLEREKDKIFKSSGFFRIEYVSPPLEKKKKKLGYAARREFRVWAIFQPGPLVSRFTPGGFSINFSGLVVYIEATNHTLIISFPELKIRVRSFFPSWSHFQLSFFSLTLTNTFSNF